MKFNLKTLKDKWYNSKDFNLEEIRREIEGIEKELRELMPSREEYEEAQRLRDYDVQRVYELIEEILGE